MKISVCIPIYNFDVRDLVSDLKSEIQRNKIEAEIILIDDASHNHFKQLNTEISNEAEHFIYLEQNAGRSRIRNMFSKYAQGEFLLFLDCDGKMIHSNFLKNYSQFIDSHPESSVVYGGRKVGKKPVSDQHILRWKFAVERENLSLEKRLSKPYLSFQTNNFLIRKNVLDKIPFNSKLQKYGYEDLVFSMDLKFAGIEVFHTDNPIFNNDVENSAVYLGKVEESVENLLLLLKDPQMSEKLTEIKLVQAYHSRWIKMFRIPLLFLFSVFEKFLKRNLLSTNPHLKFLDLYKLGLILKKS